ncbi:MAG TPA: MBOAT family protein [Alphaproteobacteria bacterium]
MNFDSLLFFAFVLVVAPVMYVLPRDRYRHIWLLAASWLFYGAWDVRFLALFILMTVASWYAARLIAARPPNARRGILTLAIAILLGNLALFKYFDFFSKSFAAGAHALGFGVDPVFLNVILPIGISFYTFQAVSYLVDVHRGKLEAEPDFIRYALYLGMFPHVIAGPIVRAVDLLPQIRAPWQAPSSAEAAQALARFLWGLFKKVFIADRLAATIVDPVFSNPGAAPGGAIILAVIGFGLLVYADFSGYSDMAISLARLLGYRFKENFHAPYWAASPREFWRRWHISLSEWIRDYVYIPLGGSRGVSPARAAVNAFASMALCGLWHGAAVTYVVWGAWHGLLLVIGRASPAQAGRAAFRPLGWIATTLAVYAGWAIFRAQSLGDIGIMIARIGETGLSFPNVGQRYLLAYLLIAIVVYAEQAVIDRWKSVRHWISPAHAVGYHTAASLVLGFGMLLLFRPEVGFRNFVYFQF